MQLTCQHEKLRGSCIFIQALGGRELLSEVSYMK